MTVTSNIRRDILVRHTDMFSNWRELNYRTKEQFLDDIEAACRSIDKSGVGAYRDVVAEIFQAVVDKYGLKEKDHKNG